MLSFYGVVLLFSHVLDALSPMNNQPIFFVLEVLMFAIEIAIYVTLMKKVSYLQGVREESGLQQAGWRELLGMNVVVALLLGRGLMSVAVHGCGLLSDVKNTLDFYFFELYLQTIVNPVIDMVTGITVARFILSMGRHLEKQNLIALATDGRQEEANTS